MILELCYYDDPRLRLTAQPIEEITLEIRELAHNMVETMYAANGIGLAATQVGKPWRMFVSNVAYEDAQGEVHLREPRVFINPVISNLSDIMVERSEGCLSIPKLYGSVLRPYSLTVEALNLEGQPFKEECAGYLARNVLHEVDHLDGILFIDRIKGKKRSDLEPMLRVIKQKYSKK